MYVFSEHTSNEHANAFESPAFLNKQGKSSRPLEIGPYRKKVRMLSRNRIKLPLLFAAVVVGIYYSPHFFSRFCISEGRMLSNRSIVEQTAQWLIENEHPNAVLKDDGLFGKFILIENGEFVLQFNIGKFELWNPLFSNYPNHVYVHGGGSYFFIFDACGNKVAARG